MTKENKILCELIKNNELVRKPDCSAFDCIYNVYKKCTSIPFITISNTGTCLDYNIKNA